MSLVPRFTLGDLDLTDDPYSVAFGSDFGAPENAAEVIASLLQDGEVVSSSRSSNREIQLTVYVSGSDLQALADAEDALIEECEKPRNELVVDPGDGFAAATVFDTFRVQPRLLRSDDEEIGNVRTYLLTIPALPFARSVDEITVDALTSAAVPSTVTISNADTVTGWTQQGYAGGPVTAAEDGGDYVFGNGNYQFPTGFQGRLTFTAAAPVDLSATPYVQVQGIIDSFATLTNRAFMLVDGVDQPLLSQVSAGDGVSFIFTFQCFDSAATEFEIGFVGQKEGGSAASSIRVYNLAATNIAPTVGTGRQQFRTIETVGSVRTPASLQVAHDATALGDVIVYSSPDLGAYSPALSPTSLASRTADVATVSGSRFSISSVPETYRVPAMSLPSGGYVVMARARATSGIGPSKLRAEAGTGYAAPGAGVQATERWIDFLVLNAWQVVTVGALNLPTVAAPIGSVASVYLELSQAGGTGGIEIDEVWLFHMEDRAALTVAACGTATPSAGGSSNRLWVDSPTIARPVASVWRGTLKDRSDSLHAGVDASAFGSHEFVPPQTRIFTVTTNVADAEVSATYRPAWHTHAAR